MIILCNENEFEKSKLAKIHKIIISTDLANVEDSNKITQMKYLLPDIKLMHDYYNDKISEKKYKKKYIKYLESEGIYDTILTILLVYKEEKKLAIVCSKQERQFKYISFLINYLVKNFNVPVMEYSKWKEKQPDKFNINKEYFKKELKAHWDSVIGDDSKKSKGKKSDKDKKKKTKPDEIPQAVTPKDQRDNLMRKVKIRRRK
jgi:hypothetical protein